MKIDTVPQKISNASKARKLFNEVTRECNRCGTSYNVQLHHKDKNVFNNDYENLILLCASCHRNEHIKRIKEEVNKEYANR
jgi:5-methylcytosine-specific restriction endonuclease McrA